MMHALRTVAECDEAEERVRRALHDAIVDHDPALQDDARRLLTEIATARSTIPPQRGATNG